MSKRIKWNNVFKASLTGGHVAKGTLIPQLLRKLFHADVSAKNTISCSSCDQEVPPALLLTSCSLDGWLDDYDVRKTEPALNVQPSPDA